MAYKTWMNLENPTRFQPRTENLVLYLQIFFRILDPLLNRKNIKFPIWLSTFDKTVYFPRFWILAQSLLRILAPKSPDFSFNPYLKPDKYFISNFGIDFGIEMDLGVLDWRSGKLLIRKIRDLIQIRSENTDFEHSHLKKSQTEIFKSLWFPRKVMSDDFWSSALLALVAPGS